MSKSDRPKPAITAPAFRVVRPQARRPSINALRRPSIKPLGFVKEEETGSCVVCGNDVIVSHNSMEEVSGRHSMTNTGFHCSSCGLKYQFIPPKKKHR